METVFPNTDFSNIIHRKPDIVAVDDINKSCIIIEVTVCFDLYLSQAFEQKVLKYELLRDRLKDNGYEVKFIVVCFGSLGSIMDNVWSGRRYLQPDKEELKRILKRCSISCIIGSNYIWRHRVKKLFANE